MKTILILGAGRSATSLIEYLLRNAEDQGWHLRIGDYNPEVAQKKCEGFKNAEAFAFDINDAQQRYNEIIKSTLVISM